MTRIHHYISMLLFTAAVLLGLQVPNFVDQYVKRIDAHQKEVHIQYNKYLEIAKRHGQGGIEALIKKHENSTDPTFRAVAEPIRNNYQRKQHFDAELASLEGGFWAQALHVIFSGDREIMNETYDSFSANLPLNLDAVVCGLIFGMLISVLLELFWSLLTRLFRRKRRPKDRPPEKTRRTEPYINT